MDQAEQGTGAEPSGHKPGVADEDDNDVEGEGLDDLIEEVQREEVEREATAAANGDDTSDQELDDLLDGKVVVDAGSDCSVSKIVSMLQSLLVNLGNTFHKKSQCKWLHRPLTPLGLLLKVTILRTYSVRNLLLKQRLS